MKCYYTESEVKIRPGTDVVGAIAQLGARQTEDLEVPGSIPGRPIRGSSSPSFLFFPFLNIYYSYFLTSRRNSLWEISSYPRFLAVSRPTGLFSKEIYGCVRFP